MERHRCAHCRNPIRRGPAIARSPESDDDWFHPDCWGNVVSAQQKEYQQQIAARGLDALIAPYVVPGPPVLEQVDEDASELAVEQSG